MVRSSNVVFGYAGLLTLWAKDYGILNKAKTNNPFFQSTSNEIRIEKKKISENLKVGSKMLKTALIRVHYVA